MKKKKHIFVATSIQNGGDNSPSTGGYFYAPAANICGFETPVWSVNAPTAILVEVNGKGRNRSFISGYNKHLIGMTSETRCLNGQNVPNSDRMAHETGISLHSKLQIEMRAKNMAYAFILSRGLLSEFTEFSRADSGQCQTLASRCEMILKNC